MAHGPLDSVPEVVSALCWHESFEHAADAAPDALDVLRADSGSVFDAAGFRGSADPLIARSCGLRLRGAPCN